MDADTLRINAAAELSGRRAGGVEWQSPTVSLRLESAKHLTGNGSEEERLNLTARRTVRSGAQHTPG